jgi:hypothetical protein
MWLLILLCMLIANIEEQFGDEFDRPIPGLEQPADALHPANEHSFCSVVTGESLSSEGTTVSSGPFEGKLPFNDWTLLDPSAAARRWYLHEPVDLPPFPAQQIRGWPVERSRESKQSGRQWRQWSRPLR